MTAARPPRLTTSDWDERLRRLDRDRALASGLRPVEADVVEQCYRRGSTIADARRWFAWSRCFGAVHYLLVGAIGLPLLALVVLVLINPDVASALAGISWLVSLGIALLWLGNLIGHLLTPNVLRITARATRTWAEAYWSRAVRAVAEVDAALGDATAASFDGALDLLYPDAVRLAEGDELWTRLNGPDTSDPALAGLRVRVEQQVSTITTEAIRLLSGRPAALEASPVEWHAASAGPGDAAPAPELANEDDLR